MLTYDAGFWEKIKEEERYKPLLESLNNLYGEWCEEPPKSLKYSEFKLFYETGDRKTYETSYFLHRKQLAVSAVMYLIYRKEADRSYLEDVLWAICDEYSWCVPAHIQGESAEERFKTIDLFASETAFSLGELVSLMGDALDETVRTRVRYEIRRRVIQPFLNAGWWWEKATNNWASVCACQVAGAILYTQPALFPKVKPRIEAAMHSFLNSFGNDGACLEGVSYWIYGFGMFALYHELLTDVEPDATAVFQDEKVKNIAMFFQKSCLRGGIAVTFSDCQPQALYSLAIGHYLKRIYGDDVKLPPFQYHLPLERSASFTMLVRAFLYYNPADNGNEQACFEYYLPDAQWYIRQTERYSFAAKGGHNDESHNHNDIGSFLLCRNGRQILCDIGVGLYTKDYFPPETRYTFLGNSSRGHSVPRINGQEQRAGSSCCAREVRYERHMFSADILGAYGMPGSLTRTFETLEDRVRLTDTYRLEANPESIAERFVSYENPKLEEGRILWKDLALYYPAEMLKVEIGKETYENNFMGIFTVYLIDLKVIAPKQNMKIKLEFVTEPNHTFKKEF